MNTKSQRGGNRSAPDFPLILDRSLTVPELMYLFFFSFFFAFTTWHECRIKTKDNDNVNLKHNPFHPPLGK